MSEETADRQAELPAQSATGCGPWCDRPRKPDEPIDPWAPGRTFRDEYLAGDLPWPREFLFWGNEGGGNDMVNEYLEHIRDLPVAVARGNERTVRRLRGEIEAVEHEFEHMDSLWAAEVFSDLRAALNSRAETATVCRDEHSAPAAPALTAPETERFVGPAPFYRRGRIYVQGLAFAAETASGVSADHRPQDEADQLLRVVEACEDPEDLQDFIAGISREVKRQLARRHLTEVCRGVG